MCQRLQVTLCLLVTGTLLLAIEMLKYMAVTAPVTSSRWSGVREVPGSNPGRALVLFLISSI